MPVIKLLLGDSEVLSIFVNPDFKIVISGEPEKKSKSKEDSVVINLEEEKKKVQNSDEVETYDFSNEIVKETVKERSEIEKSVMEELEDILSSVGGVGTESRESKENVEEGNDTRETPVEEEKDENVSSVEKHDKVRSKDKAKELLTEILDFGYG